MNLQKHFRNWVYANSKIYFFHFCSGQYSFHSQHFLWLIQSSYFLKILHCLCNCLFQAFFLLLCFYVPISSQQIYIGIAQQCSLATQQVLVHSVHWGINLPSKTPPLFLAKPPLNQQTVQAPSFLGNSPLYIGFLWTPPPPKSQIFQWTAKILKFFILNTILSFKSN